MPILMGRLYCYVLEIIGKSIMKKERNCQITALKAIKYFQIRKSWELKLSLLISALNTLTITNQTTKKIANEIFRHPKNSHSLRHQRQDKDISRSKCAGNRRRQGRKNKPKRK